MYNKELAMMAGVALKAAATAYQGQSIQVVVDAAKEFHAALVSLAGGFPPDQAPAPQTAGVQVQPPVAQPQASPIQVAEQNLQAAGMNPTTVRDLSNEEARWRDLFAHPDDWWNNTKDPRASINGGKGPDFRYKHDDNVPGLWLKGKFGPAPAWVFERLGIPFPGQQVNGQPQVNGQGGPVPF
ncbi:MAG TPA: hypothetical protein VF377_08760 [Acidimicrobiia bacterium]